MDLNCDLGEGYPNDAELMALISSANIACGYHAGDRETMRRCVDLAIQNGVAIGAHPGFADKENFGRREMQLPQQAYRDLVLEQLEILHTIVQSAGAELHHVKPHGALYNMAARDPELAHVLAQAVFDFNPALILYGLSGSPSISQAKALSLRTANEVFADRSYQADATLTPRSQPGALLDSQDKCLEQVLEMALENTVTAMDGTKVAIQADSICLHGDGIHGVEFARAIRAVLLGKNIAIHAPPYKS